MAVEISKIDIWSGEIQDRSGGLADKIEALADVGANLEFVIARRSPDKPGTGLVFVAPVRGHAQILAARTAGLAKAPNVYTLRIEAPNRAGLGASMMRAVADAGINMRGLSGTALGRRCALYFAFDTNADANAASRVLKNAFAER